MAVLKIVDTKKNPVGEIEVSDSIFNVEVNQDLLYEAVKNQMANRRQGTACTKTRGEISGSTRKLFRQKGTGRARRGSIKSPVLRGGGTVHGPKPRDYSYTLPKKVRMGALKSALSDRFQNENLIAMENFDLAEIKTKNIVSILGTLGATRALIVDDENGNLKKSVRNLAKSDYLHVDGLNVRDILLHDTLILTRKAIEKIEGRLG